MSQILPSVSELRATQKQGMQGEGLNDYDCTDLNAVQGHKADIKEYVDGAQTAKTMRRIKMENQDADNARLDRTEKGSWPDITEI